MIVNVVDCFCYILVTDITECFYNFLEYVICFLYVYDDNKCCWLFLLQFSHWLQLKSVYPTRQLIYNLIYNILYKFVKKKKKSLSLFLIFKRHKPET